MPPTKPYLQIGSTQIELGNLKILDEGAHGIAYSVTAQPNSKVDELQDKLILDPGSRTFVIKKAKNAHSQEELEKEAEVSIQISAAITESGKGLEATRLLNATTSAVLVEEDRLPQAVIVGHQEKIGLPHFLAANKDLSAAQKIKMLTDIMKQQWDAVQLFHWGLKPRYFVHGDIAMRNFLVSANGQIKLSDFGTAQAISANVTDSVRIDDTGPLKWLPADTIRNKDFNRAGDIVSLKITYLEEIATFITGDKLSIWRGEYDLLDSMTTAFKHAQHGDNWYLQALYSNLKGIINGIQNEKDRVLYNEFVTSLELVFTSPKMTDEGQIKYAQQQLDKGLSATRTKPEIQNAPSDPLSYEPPKKKVEEDEPENAYGHIQEPSSKPTRAREKPTPVDEQSSNNPEEWSKEPSLETRKTKITIASQRLKNDDSVASHRPKDDNPKDDNYGSLPSSIKTTALGSHRIKKQDSDDYGALPVQSDYGAFPKFDAPNNQTTTMQQGSRSSPSPDQIPKDVLDDYGKLPVTYPRTATPSPTSNPPIANPAPPKNSPSTTYAVTHKMQMEAKKTGTAPQSQAPQMNTKTEADKKAQPVGEGGSKVSGLINKFEQMSKETAVPERPPTNRRLR